MPEPYSLAEQPWLPVLTVQNRRAFIPIREIGRPDVLRIDTGRADCDISLTEFLIGLLAISMAPEDERDWLRRFRNPPSEAEIADAIAPYAHALLLDGPGPRFLQDFEALQGENWDVEQFLIEAPGEKTRDENADHFIKRGSIRTLSRAAAALLLLNLQTRAPGGGRGHLGSMRGGGAATTLIIPQEPHKPTTLWQVLWSNTPSGYGVAPEELTKAMPWLSPTRTSENGQITTPEHSKEVVKAQVFFGMPRRIRLNFSENKSNAPCDFYGITDDFVVHNYITRPYGIKYKNWIHPLTPYEKEKAGTYRARKFVSSKVAYGQWIGLTLKTGQELRRPSENVFTFVNIRACNLGIASYELTRRARLLACGYVMDPQRTAIPLDFTEAMLPLISTGDAERDIDLAECAEKLIAASQEVEFVLLRALKIALFSEAKVDSGKTPLDAPRARFWAETEADFYRLLRQAAVSNDPSGAAFDQAREAWLPIISGAALRIFDETAPVDSPEDPDIEQVVKGRNLLFFALQGYGPSGKKLFEALGKEPPQTKKAKGKAA